MINIKVEEVRKDVFTNLEDYETLCRFLRTMNEEKDLYKEVLRSYHDLRLYLIDLLMDYLDDPGFVEDFNLTKQGCWEMIEAIQYYAREHRK